MEITINQSSHHGIALDPRTKMLLVITIATTVISGKDSGLMLLMKPILSLVPFILLLFSRRVKLVLSFVSIYLCAYLGQVFLLPATKGIVNICVVVFCGIFFRMLPGLMMAAYLVGTTKVSEFMAAMNRLHMPDVIAIPISVMFRFFPTVKEEYGAIADAMQMRGVRFGGSKISKMLEYRLVPLMMSCVKIGEELSAAALVRGLGAPVKRTNIGTIGFGAMDAVLLLLCLGAMIVFVLSALQLV